MEDLNEALLYIRPGGIVVVEVIAAALVPVVDGPLHELDDADVIALGAQVIRFVLADGHHLRRHELRLRREQGVSEGQQPVPVEPVR